MNEKRGLLIKRTTMMLVGILFISICVGCYRLSGFGVDAAERLFRAGLMRRGGLVLVEHAAADELQAVPGVMRLRRTKKFGKCAVSEMEYDDSLESDGTI